MAHLIFFEYFFFNLIRSGKLSVFFLFLVEQSLFARNGWILIWWATEGFVERFFI